MHVRKINDYSSSFMCLLNMAIWVLKVSKGGIQNQVILDPNRPGPQLRDMGNNMHVIKSLKRRPLSKV